MAYTEPRARYEAALARAHRAMSTACAYADTLRDPGAAYDCDAIAREIIRLANDSLREKPSRKGKLDNDRAYL